MKSVNIIGSGVGALTCGAYLSKNGFKVRIFERLNKPGGVVDSMKRGKYNFEASTHQIGGFRLFKMICRTVGLKKVDIHKMENLYTVNYSGKNDETYRLPAKYKSLKKYLSDIFPDEKKSISRFLKEVRGVSRDVNRLGAISTTDYIIFRLYDAITALMLLNGKSGSLKKKIGMKSYKYVVKYSKTTIEEFIAPFNFSDKLKSILMQYSFYLSTSVPEVSTIIMCMVLNNYIDKKPFLIKDGTHSLVKGLADLIEENGGEVFYKNEIKKIVVDNGMVKEIIDKKDNSHIADYTISNVSSLITFNQLIDKDKLPEDFVEHISNIKLTEATFQIYVGLPYLIDKDKFPSESMFFNKNFDVSRLENEISDDSTLMMTNYKHLNHNHTGLVLVEYDSFSNWENVEYHSEEYKKLKSETEKKILDKFKKLTGLDLEKDAEVIVSATPLTDKHYMNNTRGEMCGPKYSVDQVMSNRTANHTPIENLFLAGQYTQPGGGVCGSMRGGVITAKAIIKHSKKIV